MDLSCISSVDKLEISHLHNASDVCGSNEHFDADNWIQVFRNQFMRNTWSIPFDQVFQELWTIDLISNTVQSPSWCQPRTPAGIQVDSRFPSRAYLLEGVPPLRLTRSSCIAFQFSTGTLKTKDWRHRHNQPLDTEAVNSTCRLFGSQKESATHLVHDCTSEGAPQARGVLKSCYVKSKKDIPVGLTRLSVDLTRPHWDTVKEELRHCTMSSEWSVRQEEQKAANRSLQGQDEAFEQDKGNKCEGSVWQC